MRDRGIEISRERVRESKYVSLKTHHFLSIWIQHATLFYCIVFKYAGLQLLRALRMWERKSCGFQKIRLLTHTHNAKPPHTLSLTHTYIHTYINAHIHTQARPSKPLGSHPTTYSATSMTNQRCPVNLRVLVFQIIIRLGLRSLFTREWDSVPRNCRGSVHRVNTPLERRTDVHPLSCGAHNHAHARASVHRCSERLIDVDHITQRLVLQER